MKFEIEEIGTVYKVGITCVDPVDRMLQIIRSFFQTYRYVPRTSLKRFRKVEHHFIKETALHREFGEHQCEFSKAFDGCTEFFNVCEEDVLQKYDELCP